MKFEMNRFFTAAMILLIAVGCRPHSSGDQAGTISIQYEPEEAPEGCEGGVFYIDGKMQGHYPIKDFPVKAGSRTITINSQSDCAGYGDLRLEIEAGESHVLHPKQFR